MEKSVLLNIDDKTAHHYGLIKTDLLNKGKPIPENNIWIGAVAMQYDLLILTKDKHFRQITGIQVKYW